MGLAYLWDTNAVIYHLKNEFPPQSKDIIDALILRSEPMICSISEIELLSWKNGSASDLNLLNVFLSKIYVYELMGQVKAEAAFIRRTSRLKLPDAIIAATAIVHNLTLVTRNSKDFELVPNLALLNPWAVQL